MTANYVLLEKITVGAAGASSVTFSSIPQTGYTDLVVKASVRDTYTGAVTRPFILKLNGSATSYSAKFLLGDGASASSFSDTSGYIAYENTASSTSNTFASVEIYLPNYTSSNYKSYSIDSVTENNATTANASMTASLWSNTAAVTSISLEAYSGNNFTQYSTFYLYGVAKLGTTPAIVPYATGGDTIMTDGTYWYHAFKSSGTFTPAKALSCDVLVVAGGGGGGVYGGGGGGAGGVYYSAGTGLGTSAYTVTIGAGGAGGQNVDGSFGSNGSNSQFGALTAAVGGGGGGGTGFDQTGLSGGSGGGSSGGLATGTTQGGTATSGQGNTGGGSNYVVQNATAGGGGGGGGSGASPSPLQNSGAVGQAGGAGTNTYSSWLSVVGMGVSGFIAGGGGGSGSGTGGTAGSGGAGAGAGGVGAAASSATANTGSGGGGTYISAVGGNGGSGLVVVRYAV